MQYFSEFPKISYNFNYGNENRLIVIRDIGLNLRFVKNVLTNIDLFNEYDIEDGETPEHIAEKIYGSATLHWAIMLFNERFDYINDWPRTESALLEFVIEKYGEDNIHDQHIIFGNPHYEDQNKNIFYKLDPVTSVNTSETTSYWKKVSNYEHESNLNESKRRIKLLDPKLMTQVVNEYQSAFEVIKL